MGKKVLAVILGLCIIALAGTYVYMYITFEQSTKVKIYSGKESENQEEADVKEGSNKKTENQFPATITISMDGFTLGSQDTLVKNDESDITDNEVLPDNDYILPDSDSKYYKTKDLKKLTRQEVKLARNEIYARHGRKFTKDMSVKEYFEGKDWYSPVVDEVADSELNKYEIANRDLIIAYEEKKNWR